MINFRRALIEEFLERGIDVVALAPQIDDHTRQELRALGATPRRLSLQRRRMLSFGDALALGQLMFHLSRSRVGDVVVPYTVKPILLAGLAHRLTHSRARFVPMFTGLGFLRRIGDGARAQAVLAVLRFALARASSAIVQHDADREWLERHRILPEGIEVSKVPGSGVDTNHFRPEPLPEVVPPVLLFLGRMVPEKGIVAFCDYAKKAGFDARWVAVGPFEDHATRDDLRHLMRSSGVEYLGAAKDVRPYLAGARALVLVTTYGEGVPRVILEAMAAGRAIVASDAPGCRVALRDGVEGWLIDPEDHAAVLARLEQLSNDVEVARTLGSAGRRRAVEVFEARRVAALTADAVLEEGNSRT